jgi:hypothetical protein
MTMECETARGRVLLALYGEIPETERMALQAHAEGCDACRLVGAEERRLHGILAERMADEPSDDLLALCRRDLARALDAAPAPHRRLEDRLHRFWLGSRLSPAWAVVLVMAGFLAGVVALRGLPHGAGGPAGPAPVASVEPVAGGPLANILSLESAPDRDHVRLSYDTTQRASLEGSAGDPAIRDLLVRTVSDSLNAGLRLEAIEALRHQTDQESVRRVLMEALRADDNAGARLRAIEALGDRVPGDPDVRRAVLEALQRDANPGVRVRAVDVLSRAHDPQILPVMERLSREDPDTYIRMRSGDFVDAMYARSQR